MSLSIEELKKLREEITPGPWEVYSCNDAKESACEIHSTIPPLPPALYDKTKIVLDTNHDECCHMMFRPDAALIAAAPSLLSELIALKEWKENLRNALLAKKRITRDMGSTMNNRVIDDVLSLLQQD
jgi:hypothetical protein